ncbi:MAG: response regulator transcription factor [Gammaproteobacteria bacterium]|jgi:two-component system response regulator RegX3
MRQPQVLIIEDEAAIRTGLADALVYHGFGVHSEDHGASGLERALSGKFDLILLDIMLPGVDGFTICEEIRKVDRRQPIIMLTAKTSDEDIISGLSLGADDYVAKPFSVAQLVLRIKAVLRRASIGIESERTIELGQYIRIDLENLTGSNGGVELTFTRREADILQYLRANQDRPVSRDELLNKVWGYDRNSGVETRTVDIHIAKLRRKIEPEPKAPRFLVTVRGAGYRLTPESDSA